MRLVCFKTTHGGRAYVNPEHVVAVYQGELSRDAVIVMSAGALSYTVDAPVEDVIRALRAFDETEAWDT